MNVQLFIPCFVDQIFPETGLNMVKVLEKAGCQVHYNENQTCCGQPAFNAGFWDEAKAVGQKFLEDFHSYDYIVSPSASCTGFIRNYYTRLFDNSAVHNEVKLIRKNLFEFSEFLVDILHLEDFGARFEDTVTFHDSCSGLRECKIKEAPRRLLNKVQGLTLKEMEETETCCGFGGTFAVKFDGISLAMAEQKLEFAQKTGARFILSTDLSCLMHLDGVARKRNLDIRTLHIADVLASGW